MSGHIYSVSQGCCKNDASIYNSTHIDMCTKHRNCGVICCTDDASTPLQTILKGTHNIVIKDRTYSVMWLWSSSRGWGIHTHVQCEHDRLPMWALLSFFSSTWYTHSSIMEHFLSIFQKGLPDNYMYMYMHVCNHMYMCTWTPCTLYLVPVCIHVHVHHIYMYFTCFSWPFWPTLHSYK